VFNFYGRVRLVYTYEFVCIWYSYVLFSIVPESLFSHFSVTWSVLLVISHMIMNIYTIDFFLCLSKLLFIKKKKKKKGEICAKSPIQHNTGPCDDDDD
jgi:hypothetical protein